MEKQISDNIKYLELLSRQFPTMHEAATEIINLEAIMNLPKGTEHFLSDLHGEDEAFMHIVKSGSGIIRAKIDLVFGSTITNIEKRKLATLIYYPKEVLLKRKGIKRDREERDDWYEVMLNRLVMVLREVSSKYTRSKVRKALPPEFAYIIEELLHQSDRDEDKNHYYNQIIQSIIEIKRSKAFIIAMSEVIQQLAVDHLHILGDIYDRGPHPDRIMNKLMDYHSIDIQWGNHDVVWMGAASGSTVCIMNVIRICARYGQLDLLEEDYGINLFPIAKYAMDNFTEPEMQFYPKSSDHLLEDERLLTAQINKAATVFMLKLEEHVADRHPEFEMDNRKLISKIDFSDLTVEVDGNKHKLLVDRVVCTDPENPIQFNPEQELVINKLQNSFLNNVTLQKHVAFLFEKGSIYKIFNGNLLYHGCIPLNNDGTYTQMTFDGITYEGKGLLDYYEERIRQIYADRETIDESERDFFWYLWSGSNSSLFGKYAMKTFERTFIEDSNTHVEEKNPYYEYIEQEAMCRKILKDFSLDPDNGIIINGHVPVKVRKGEKPVKAGGRMIVIDGGLSKAYQKVTGIAGYTFIYNSHGMLLAAHEPFTSAEDAIVNNVDMISELSIVDQAPRRILVSDTDNGKNLAQDIEDLKLLVKAYRTGIIKTLLY